MQDIIAVTATDFGVGKTWVTTALARSLAARHNDVRAVKIIETGVGSDAGAASDGVILAKATGQSSPTEPLLRFPDPVSAAEAASRAGEAVDITGLISQMRQIAANCDVMLAEGNGGLLTPLTWECTIVDVARRLGAMAVVVAPDRRGTINHALLTLRALAEANVNCLGVALNAHGESDATTGTNAAALRRLAPGTRVVETNKPGWEQRLV